MSRNEVFQTALPGVLTGESDDVDGRPPSTAARPRSDVIRIAPKSGRRQRKVQKQTSSISETSSHPNSASRPSTSYHSRDVRVAIPESVASDADTQRTVSQLMGLRRAAVRSGEYQEAQKYQQLLLSVSERAQEAATSRSAEHQIREKVVKRDELRAIVDRIAADWNGSFEEFLEATRAQAEQLRLQHEAELAKLGAECPEHHSSRRRPMTRQIAELRDKERAFVLAGQFVDAQRVKGKADRIERIECEKQAETMQMDFERRRQRTVASQKQEMTVFFAHVEATRLTMVQQRDQLVAGHLSRLRKLEAAIGKLGALQGDLSECRASTDRVARVTEGEYSYPIPRMRSGSAFTRVRKVPNET